MAEIKYEVLTSLSQGYVVARIIDENGNKTNHAVVLDKNGNRQKQIKNKAVAENLIMVNADDKGFSVAPFKNGVAIITYQEQEKQREIAITRSGYVLSSEARGVAERIYTDPESLMKIDIENASLTMPEDMKGLFDVAQHRFEVEASKLQADLNAGKIDKNTYKQGFDILTSTTQKVANNIKSRLMGAMESGKESSVKGV